MTTASDAVLNAIDTCWAGSGGTKPILYSSEDVGKEWPTDDDWIMVLNWEYKKKRRRRTDTYVWERDYVGLRVHSKNDANKEERLDEIVNEIYRVVKPTNISGYHIVDITDQTRMASDEQTNRYVADLIVELTNLNTSAPITPGGGGVDEDAIHDNVANEITAVTAKTVLVAADELILEDSEASFAKKAVTFSDLESSLSVGGDTFKTITGITNDVVADAADDTLTLASADAKLTIVGTSATDTITFTVDEAQIDHDALTNFAAGEHFTMLDEDNMVSDDNTKAATQQSVKAYVDAAGGGDAFKTITGITNDVVADASDDTLTLTSTDAKLTIVGTAATDTVTFSVIEGQIDHDALTNFVAAEHKLEAAIDHDALTNFVAAEHKLEAAIDHDALTNFVAAEHKLEAAIDHDALTNFAAGEHFTMLDEDAMGTDSDTQAATQQSIKAYIDAHCMIGAANKQYIHMAFAGWYPPDQVKCTTGLYYNMGADDVGLSFTLPLPTNRGGLKLYISNFQIGLADADANDYIDIVYIFGYNGKDRSTLDTDGTNHTAAGLKTFSGAVMPASAIDCSGVDSVSVYVGCSNTTNEEMDIDNIRMECYYAA